PYVGLEKNIPADKFIDLLKKLGLKVLRIDEVSVETRKYGWLEFNRAEVEGDIKDLASILSSTFSAAAFEWGEHTILGEISAKLWHEGVKICFPEGDEELVVVMIHDSFLDVRIPTERVKGISGKVYIAGRSYTLPLSLSDLIVIVNMDSRSIKKLEKLIEVYGKEKVLAKETIEYLELIKKRKERVERMEIDYNSGYVISMDSEGRIKTLPLIDFLIGLIESEETERVLNIIKSAPGEKRDEIIKQLEEEMEIARALGKEKTFKLLMETLSKIKE
ncbi:MAG: hypothetical protein DRN53_06030, partial [Thermoprotei archaeon]